VTATAVVQHHVCPRRYDLRYRVGAPTPEFPLRGDLFDPEAGEARDDELPAAVLGDRVHRILAEPEGSPAIAGLLADLPAAEQKEALRQVETFRRSELGRLAAGGEAWHEVPFALLREGATLRGQIDLILRRPDGALILVDYKTSRATPAEVREKALDFELQLRLYALAMRDLFGRLPARAALFFLDPGVVHDVDLSPPALSAAEQAIAAFFAAHREAAFPQNPARRHCYPCGYRTAYCPNLRFDTPSGGD
jgi:RecB family exonuclease